LPEKRRVVVSGLGGLCPIGNTAPECWRAALAGKSGIAPLTRFDSSGFSVRFAGEVKNFNPGERLDERQVRRMDLFIVYGIAAATEAVEDAGLGDSEPDSDRIGVAIGSGIGGLQTIENAAETYRQHGARRISPFFIPATIINMISGNLSIRYNFGGPNVALVSACTTGAHNIGEAFRAIARGDANAMVCGGAEAAITPLSLGGFATAKALSTRNDDPTTASRPFDKGRDGFVLGEGAGVLVLEEYERAKKRGAKIYAEVAGYGATADCFHMTAPLEDGSGAARCMTLALQDAGVAADEANYINAHGTSTPLGDVAETLAIKKALGAAAQKTTVSSTKSMTGHLLGAAGGVEAMFSVYAVFEQKIPPTINLREPDDKCDLDYAAGEARDAKVEVAISNSFGFGGTNASLLFRRL
jgi:3-oxoacyl-[acyl-carrier-protein] synthase II